jgi:cell fate regulator YaaT (PSP1 superfamily)
MVVDVQIGGYGKVCLFDSGDLDLQKGEKVLVESELGEVFGTALSMPRSSWSDFPQRPLRKVLRIAGEEDIERYKKNCKIEEEVYDFCSSKIKERALPMCLVSVECLFNSAKVIVYFTADGRVDFRDLVKDLVQRFRTRIEMKQIGVRHEARMVGGLGSCGRQLCCTSFLTNFTTVSIKMAKEQNLSLNPSKISGMCGRLMCCLNYEFGYYEKEKKNLPKVGKKVNTVYGMGKVIRQNILRGRMIVALESGEEKEISFDEIVHSQLQQQTKESKPVDES